MATKIVYIGDKPLVANGKIVQVNVDSASSVENVEWHQCPEAVRNYLVAVTYDPSDYSTSQIANYAPATAVVSNYRPIGKTLGGKTYYNQVPGVATPFANTELAGTLKPLDFLRYIRTNTWNVRDLGGWACDGGTVKYGLLFRGGEPSAADYDVLVKELGIKYDLNLRGSAEATWTKSPLGDDVYFVKADAYNWYSLTNTEAWRINLQCVFDAVAHGQPVYFHCAAGADRTGTLACVLEGLLGMSQSDIDKDYELTTFYSGSDTDANARRRNESEWKGLISAINAKSGNTFRDKCVTFVAELGFTSAEINAYRKAMINGTPETVNPNISTFTVSSVLDGVLTDNTATEVVQYQPYEAIISAQNGKTIGSVSIKMDGVDITYEVWKGNETELYRKVTLNLVNCSIDNTLSRVIDGQSYGANISPNAGYKLDDSTVSITMGGTDVSIYYSGGKIAIPRVTGDLVITISAVESGAAASNILTDSFKVGGVSQVAVGYTNGKRLSTSTGVEKDNAGSCVTGFIPCNAGSVIRIRPLTAPSDVGVGGTVPDIELYNTTNISLNKKYSGNSIIDASGSYICAPVPLDMTKYRYLKVNGAHMSGYGGAYTISEPVFHKIAFIKNNVITSVDYTNNIALSTDNTSKEWVIDMSKHTGYSDADAVRFMIMSTGAVEITESDIVPAANLHIVATAKIA